MGDVFILYTAALGAAAMWASTMGLLFWPRETWSALVQALSKIDEILRG